MELNISLVFLSLSALGRAELSILGFDGEVVEKLFASPTKNGNWNHHGA